jgi:hypothetical protein
LRRGFVEGLARISYTRCALLLPTPQNTSGATVQYGPSLLSLAARAGTGRKNPHKIKDATIMRMRE